MAREIETAGSPITDPEMLKLVRRATLNDVTIRHAFQEIVSHFPGEQQQAAEQALVILLERFGRFVRAAERRII